MAQFNVVGLDELGISFEALANTPDSVIDEMLNAGADVIEKGQKTVGERMGVHKTGVTLDSIQKSKKIKVRAAGGRTIDVYPGGINADGNRNAEVAFINEYGAPGRGIPSRPFMRTANEEYADEMLQGEYAVYDDYLKSKNL